MKQRKSNVLPATIAILVVMVAYSVCTNVMTVLMNEVIDEFSLESAAQGLMNSAIQFGGGVSLVLMPLIQGRVKKSLMLTLSVGIQAAMCVLTGAAPLFPVLIAACGLLGIGGGFTDTYANSCIVDIHQKRSARYLGLLHAIYATGAILAPVLAQALLGLTSWRGVYYVMAAVAAAATVFFVISSRRVQGLFATATDSEQKLSMAAVKQFLRDRYNLVVVVCAMFYFTSMTGLVFWLARYMKVQYNDEWMGSLALSLFWVGVVVCRLIAPRLPIKPMALVAGGTALSAVLHTIGVFGGSPVLMVAMCALNGLVSGHCIPMLLNESVSRFPGNTSLPTTVLLLASKIPILLIASAVGAVGAYSMQLSMMLTAFASVATALTALAAVAMGKKQEA